MLAAVSPAGAQITGDMDPVVMEEIRYAEKLNEWGMPDLAEKVVTRISAPEAKILIEVIKLQAYIAKGEFEEVKKLIAKKPNQESQEVWAMKLALADGYYAWGKYAEAQGIYDAFFKAYPGQPPKELRKFFLEAAYKYAQMLILMGKEEGALKPYTLAMNAIPKSDKKMRHVRRQIMGEQAELMIRVVESLEDKTKKQSYFKQIDQLCTDLLWYQDLWFGKAIVYKAHVLMMQNKFDAAEKLIKDYSKQLKQIDESLQKEAEMQGEDLTKLSPMAQCRYLLGNMMFREAKRLLKEDGDKKAIAKLLVGTQQKIPDPDNPRKFKIKKTNGAFQHVVNVFVRYPNTAWAPECGKLVREIVDLAAQELGISIDYEIKPEQIQAVEEAQFQQARSLYNQKQYDKAVQSYINVLALFPEGETPVSALGELAASYLEGQVNINDIGEMHVNMVLHYIAERFSRNQKLMGMAGDQLLKIASMYEERQMNKRRDEIYDMFFEWFTGHPRAASMLFLFGNQRMADNDIQGAKDYFSKIVKNHRNVPLYVDALGKLADCYEQANEITKSIKIREAYIQELEKKPRPGYPLANGMFKYAGAWRQVSNDLKKKSRENPAKAATYSKASIQYLVKAIKEYSKLAELLKDPEKRKLFFKTKDQEEAVNTIREGALFYQALCYSMIETSDKTKEQAYNNQALKVLSDLITTSPKSKFAPISLSQMATLYTVLDQPDQAAKTIKKLQKEYPKSKEAENAQFMLADNLLKIGRRQEAVRAFKDMFSGRGGEFPPPKILTAGTQLLEAKEYEIASEAFNQVLTKTEARIYAEPAMVGKGKALIGLKKYKEAAKTLSDMLEKFKKSGYTVEASYKLSDANSKLAEAEQDSGRRRELFDKAVDALKVARKFIGDDLGVRSELDVAVARILTAKYNAEKKFGDKATAADYLGQAVSTYQTLIMFARANVKEVLPHLENAFAEGGALMIEKIQEMDDPKVKADELKNVVSDCDRYTRIFGATSERASDIRKIKNKARSMLAIMEQTASTPQTPPAGGGAAEPAPAPQPPAEESK